MSIRPLAILDLPQLYRFRDEAIGLDTARTLTRGNPLSAARLLAYMNPARHVYSAIANGEHESVLGGIIHSRDETFARLLYLAPSSQLTHPDLPALGTGDESTADMGSGRRVGCLPCPRRSG